MGRWAVGTSASDMHNTRGALPLEQLRPCCGDPFHRFQGFVYDRDIWLKGATPPARQHASAVHILEGQSLRYHGWLIVRHPLLNVLAQNYGSLQNG